MTIEEFNKFVEWWMSKREYAWQIAEAICGRPIMSVFISDNDAPNERIGFSYYEWDDDHATTQDYFSVELLLDPNAIEKAMAMRAEKKKKEALIKLERLRIEYEELKAQYEPPKQ